MTTRTVQKASLVSIVQTSYVNLLAVKRVNALKIENVTVILCGKAKHANNLFVMEYIRLRSESQYEKSSSLFIVSNEV